jgi:hypothetical protein
VALLPAPVGPISSTVQRGTGAVDASPQVRSIALGPLLSRREGRRDAHVDGTVTRMERSEWRCVR